MSHVVLLTGATGNVGAPLLNELVRRADVAQVVALVRTESEIAGFTRLLTSLWNATGEPLTPELGAKIRIVCGDVTLPGLGLHPLVYDELARSVGYVVHAAASTQFTLPLDSARQVNCEGTSRVFELARAAVKHGHLQHMVHVSTAYVCGPRSGRICEDDAVNGAAFTNAYEQSKWEAEENIRQKFRDVPVTVVRPSIIVGDSQTGRIISCNVLYTPLRWIVQGRMTKLYCSPDTPLDVVSTDFVAEAIVYLLVDAIPAIRSTLHLTAGASKSMSVGQIVEFAIEFAEQRSAVGEAPVYRRPQLTWLEESARQGERPSPLDAYHPYMSIRRDLDTARRESILGSAGIEPRHLNQYLSNVLDYCLKTNWGKHTFLLPEGETRYKSCVA